MRPSNEIKTSVHLSSKTRHAGTIWLSDRGSRGAGRLLAKAGGGRAVFYFSYFDSNGRRRFLQIGPYDASGARGVTLQRARNRAAELSAMHTNGERNLHEHFAKGRVDRRRERELEVKGSAESAVAQMHQYEPPPAPMTTLDERSTVIPDCGGIYFVYQGTTWAKQVIYVGQASRLRRRMRAHRWAIGLRVAWIEIKDPRQRNYSEAYYIGLLRPTRNGGNDWKPFGRRA